MKGFSDMKSTPKLLMVSFDAVGDQDLELLLTLPNFSALCRRGTLVREVSSVVVSNTYPTHTTIQTGVHPRTHGVFDNEIHEPFVKGENWRFESKNIKVKTLSDAAAAAGRTVCTVLYPVTGGSPSIRYNFVEIAGRRPLLQRIHYMLRFGSTGFMLRSLLRYMHPGMLHNPKALDVFTAAIACNTIERKKPDLTMVHLLNADSNKHDYGPETPQATEALHNLDARLGDLLASVEKTGMSDSTSVIVFSDHNCCPVHTSVSPNELLKEAGLSYSDAFFHTAGGTCFLRLYNRDRLREITDFVMEFQKKPFIARLLNPDEMYTSGADSDFIYGFSAAPGYCFGEHLKGQHGYTLDRDLYHTFYLAAGNRVPESEVKKGGSLLNICPLAVDLLELDPWEMEGQNTVFN